MAAIEWAENRTGHHHRMDRIHIPGLYRHFRLDGVEGKTQLHAIIGHCAGHDRGSGSGQQGRPFHDRGRQLWLLRRFSNSHQRGQLGGILHPVTARIKESPVYAHDVLGHDHRLVVKGPPFNTLNTVSPVISDSSTAFSSS